MRRVLVINGPNLNLLGERDTNLYGAGTLGDLTASCRTWGEELGIEVRALQSNHEGAIIDGLHDARTEFDGVVLNPGAYAHTSYAIRDAIDAIGIPVVEVHISNIAEREPWRRTSVTAPPCIASIYGRGIDGYRWALRKLRFAEAPSTTVAYGAGADQVGDLRTSRIDAPLAMLVHGGFWRQQWTRDLMDGLAVDLFERGYTTLNVEYRRTGTGGGVQTSSSDVAAAIGWASHRYPRTIVIGHSAGGQLALTAARRMSIELIVSLAGITDLAAAVADELGDGAATAFLGDEDPSDASPIEMLPLGVTQLVVHGNDDDVVPVSYARRYVDAARAEGDGAQLLELPDVGHMELIDERSAAWATVVKRMEELL